MQLNKKISDIKTLFEKKDDYYKAIKLDNFWNNNYVEYECKCDTYKNLAVKEYLNKI